MVEGGIAHSRDPNHFGVIDEAGIHRRKSRDEHRGMTRQLGPVKIAGTFFLGLTSSKPKIELARGFLVINGIQMWYTDMFFLSNKDLVGTL